MLFHVWKSFWLPNLRQYNIYFEETENFVVALAALTSHFQIRKDWVRPLDVAAPVSSVTLYIPSPRALHPAAADTCFTASNLRKSGARGVATQLFRHVIVNISLPGARLSPPLFHRQLLYGLPRCLFECSRASRAHTCAPSRLPCPGQFCYNRVQARQSQHIASEHSAPSFYSYSKFDFGDCSASERHTLFCDNYGVAVTACSAARLMRIVTVCIINSLARHAGTSQLISGD